MKYLTELTDNMLSPENLKPKVVLIYFVVEKSDKKLSTDFF